MTGSLRHELEAFLHGWREDISPQWSQFLAGTEPDLTAVPSALTFDSAHPIIPGRRTGPNPGAPSGAHVFRAFDAIDPAQVSVVVIGQDPYPSRARATGRAFEDGALTDWSGSVAASLKPLMQSMLALRHDRAEWANGASGWSAIRAALESREIVLDLPSAHFDRLQDQGVVFVNAGWTLTRFVPGGGADQEAHIALWRPVMTRLLVALAQRDTVPVVYLLLGSFARRLFDATGIEARAKSAGSWETRVAKVVHPHPNARGPSGFLAAGNPFAEVNRALTAMSGSPVRW